MQISRVNSTNFKGLWELGKSTGQGWDEKRRCPVYFEDAIYHPFRDESEADILKAVEKEKKTPVWMYQYNESIVVINHKIGERLGVNKSELEQIQRMRTISKPDVLSYRYSPLDENPSDFKRSDDK